MRIRTVWWRAFAAVTVVALLGSTAWLVAPPASNEPPSEMANVAVLASLSGAPSASLPLSNRVDGVLLEQLKKEMGGSPRVAMHPGTGMVAYVGTDPNRARYWPTDGGVPTSEDAARNFLTTYGSLFGLTDQALELTATRDHATADGRAFVRFQQYHQGVPVIGGELIVQMDSRKAVVSVDGEITPAPKLGTKPAVSARDAEGTATRTVASASGLPVGDLRASGTDLRVLDPVLLDISSVSGPTLVWLTLVTSPGKEAVDEVVLVDARSGGVAFRYSRVETALNRRTYTANNTFEVPGTLVCDESSPDCAAGDAQAKAAQRFAGDTYRMYQTEYGRDSIDGKGMPIVSTVHYRNGYDNAFWSPELQQMVYGDAFGYPLEADVVAHELTHGVTDATSRLVYQGEAGAISESFSDLWGEFVDQDYASDGGTPAERWLLGEQISGLGAVRSMKDPPRFHQPDRVGSDLYSCGLDDNGGVHTNSGVNNKAVYLMVDGGSFNGRTVAGLGYSKVGRLYYEVQTNLLPSGASYRDLYAALVQSADNLDFTAAEKQSVRNALEGVEMNQPARCAGSAAAVPTPAAGGPWVVEP